MVLRLAPHVTGDGRSSVLELILARERAPLGARPPAVAMTVDLDSILSLAARGLAASSGPGAGEPWR